MVDVIIVGAGLSGLTCAYKILKKNSTLKLVIIEARNKIGGQLAPTDEGEIVGKWITADQYHIYNLLLELNIPMRRRTPVSKNLKRCWSLDEDIFAPIAKFELKRYMKELNLKSQLFRPGSCCVAPEDREYSMWDNISAKLFFKSSRVFMKNFVRLVAGTDASEICYVEFMHLLQSCRGLTTLEHLYIEFPPDLLEFSSEQLLVALYEKIETVDIHMNSKVVEIVHSQDSVQVREVSGRVHISKVVILAVPPNQIVDIFITPLASLEWNLLFPSTKYYITSFKASYSEAYWRRKGLSGNLCIADPPIYAQQYQPSTLTGCILHGEGFQVLTKSIVLKVLSEHFGEEMANPVVYKQQTFEQASLLSLPTTTPWNRITWASSSAATIYRGCISGAVQSGLKAAVLTLLVLRPQNVTWQDWAEIQSASVVHHYPGCWELMSSSMNVYNTLFYATVGLVLYYIVKNRNKIL